MSLRPLAILCLLAALLVAGIATGCGEEEEELEVVEGEPVELDELSYNIALTRFLNPADNEDAEYLVGKDPPTAGNSYLAVFLTIENESEDSHDSAAAYEVLDTQGSRYEALESESPYALEIGDTVPAEDELPLADTTAQTGPIHGAMLLFYVSDDVTENRPLELEIHSESETGLVELDI